MFVAIHSPLRVGRSGLRRRMNIVNIRRRIHVCMLLLVPGQTNYRVMNDATALVAAGYHVTIVDVVAQRTVPRTERYHGIDFKHVVAPSWFTPSRMKCWFIVKMFFVWVRCFFQMAGIDADVYHAHVEYTFLVAYLIARLRRKRLIFDTPELTMSGPAILRWPRIRMLAISVIRMMSRYCDVHITGSPLYVPVLARLYGSKRICVIRHIPPYHRAIKRDFLHQKLGLSLSTRIALYQGYLQSDRGLTLLLQAAEYLPPDIVIVMMGNNYGTTEAELRAFIQREQLEARVKIIPAVPYDCLLDWTAAADIGLLLLPPDYSESIRKCLPNKFFEYLMAGLPMVVSRLDMVAKLVQCYNVGVVVDDLTPWAVGEAITALMNDPERMARMHERALHTIDEAGLCWEKEQKKLIRYYRSIHE